MPLRHPVTRIAALVAAVLVLTGCAGETVVPPPASWATRTAVPTTPPSSPDAVGEPTPGATIEPWVSLVATATDDAIDVFTERGATEPERTITSEETVSLPGQIPMTFLVIDADDTWLHVYLPVRPNGSSGWIRAQDVELSSTDFRLEVRLTEHRLLLHRAEEVVLDVPVGLGRSEVPTPGGVYYVKELLQPPEADSIYGAYAYGLSGYSPVLESFAGGQGVIGIHGTNEPASVGTDASHGCIRMYNEDVTRLVEEFGLPLGTPVEIVA